MEVVNRNKQACDVIWHPHPITPTLGRQVIPCVITEGSTVRELLLRSSIDTMQPIVVSLDGRMLTVAEWDLVCPRTGQLISVQSTVMGGGDGGSNPLQAVAMIALVVAVVVFQQYYLLPALGATGSALAGAAIMMAGSMIINAVFAANTPSTSLADTSGTYSQGSPTYSLAGGSNRARPYESMPVIFGRTNFFPDLSARPFIEYKGSDQYLYQIFNTGLSSAIFSEWKIGTTPITDYTDFTWSYPDENGKLNSFPSNVDTIAGADLTHAAGWISRTTSTNTTRIGIDIEGTLYYANNAGGLDNTSVQIKIQYKPSGSSTWLDPETIISQGDGFVAGEYQTVSEYVESGYESREGSGEDVYYVWVDTSAYEDKTYFIAGSGNTVVVSGASQTPKRASLFIDVPLGQYDVRVSRDTADSTDTRLQNKTNWSALRSYQRDNSNYKGQNRLGLTIKASSQLNGTIQQLSSVVSARALYWDGAAFVFGETSNPAHWFMDFVLGRKDAAGKLMYGIGMDSSKIDLDGLHVWSLFCADEGLTFNAVIDGSQTASDIITAIARCGFGSPTWASGKLGVVWDARNASPVAAFGMSNIIRGSFNVSYITEQLAEEIVVRYVNPDKDWVQDEVRVLVPNIVTPTRSSTVDLFGCTDAVMAGKFANYIAAQQYYRTRRIQWDCDFEGFVCQRGDVVLLSHDLTQWGYSGRLVSVDDTSDVLTTTLTLDRSVPRNGSVEYLMLKRPDGSMVTYSVLASNVESNTVVIDGDVSLQAGVEEMDHIWFFSPLQTTGKKVKILSVQPSSESRLTVIATDEFTEFYDAWDGGYSIPPANTLLTKSPVTITNLTLSVRGAVANNAHVNRVSASWGVGGGTQYSLVRFYLDGNLIKEIPQSLVTGQDIDVSSSGSLLVEVTPVGTTGYGAMQTATITLSSVDLPSPPSSVTTISSANGRTSTFEWPAVYGVQSYVVEIWSSGALKRSVNIGNSLSWSYSFDDAVSDGGAFRSYQFRVYSVATSGQSTAYASADISNPQIGSLANASVTALPMSFWFNCTKPTEPDFAGVMVWLSSNPSFTPSDATLVYDGSETWVSISALHDGSPLVTGTTYYLYAAGYDSYGKDNLVYTGKFTQSVLSPAWALIDGDIKQSILDSGLNTKINQIATNATAITNEQTTRANADTALASSITTLQSTVSGNTASIQTTASTVDGINAKYAVKIDNNGYVSGYGLISTANNATPTSEFIVVADRFALAPVATNPNAVDGSPFFVLTSPTTISGVSIPAGTYIKSAWIHDASITNAKIQDASIQSAKIAALDAGKITSGYIDAARINAGSIDSKIANITNAQIGSLDAGKITSGYIDAARINVGSIDAKIATINNAQIGNLQVDTIKIANNAVTIPSSAYSSYNYIPVAASGPDTNGGADVVSIVFASSGAPRLINFVCGVSPYAGSSSFPLATAGTPKYWAYLLRNGEWIAGASSFAAVASPLVISFLDTSPAGTYTYKVYIYTSNIAAGYGPNVSGSSLNIVEVKK